MNLKNINDSKSLLVGASGQIGGQIRLLLDPACVLVTARETAPEGGVQLDLASIASVDEAEFAVAGHQLDAVYCIAGMTAVDRCEDEPELAYAINCRGPQVLAQLAARRGIPYVFFSTDYVFDGELGNYTENSATRPLNIYGSSKREGELAVLEASPDAMVLRTTTVYGPDAGRKNNYLYSVMRNLRDGVSMRVPQDQIASPSYNRDVARATVGLVARRAKGIFHVCGPQIMGRLEFARAIAAILGLEASLLHGVDTSELNQKARRPLSAGMLTERLQQEHPDLLVRSVYAALEDCRPELNAFLATSPDR